MARAADRMLIHLPTGLTPVVVDTLALVQSGGIQSLDLVEEREGRPSPACLGPSI